MQLVILSVINVVFALAGVLLNLLVIVSFWKSSQLKKKLCYFTIMILSCLDLLAAITNHPLQVMYSVLWLTENCDLLSTIGIYLRLSNMFIAFSLLQILVMSIERYLAATHPFFHRTSVDKPRLFIVLSLFVLFDVVMYAISYDGLAITFHAYHIIFYAVFSPPFLFANYKLFRIAAEIRRRQAISPKAMVHLKSISSCLLVVVCYLILSIPSFVYTALSFIENPKSDVVKISWAWGSTIATTNSTFNCLIFYWSNPILRTEAMNVFKSRKYRRN